MLTSQRLSHSYWMGPSPISGSAITPHIGFNLSFQNGGHIKHSYTKTHFSDKTHFGSFLADTTVILAILAPKILPVCLDGHISSKNTSSVP